MRIAGLSRANKKDIERCYEAVQHAPLNRIHTFLASSDIHLEHKLKMTRSQCRDKAPLPSPPPPPISLPQPDPHSPSRGRARRWIH